MASIPHLASSPVSLPVRSLGHVPFLAVGASAGLGAAALLIVIRGMELSPTAIAFGVAATLVAVLAVPLAVTRGVAFVVAVCSSAVLAPTSAPGPLILLGVGLSCLALGLALVRTWTSGSSGALRLRRTSAIGVAAYLGLVLASTTVGARAYDPAVVLVSVVLPAMLALLVARRFNAEDVRVLARGISGFAVLQVFIGTVDLFVRPLPFLGYATLDGVSRLTNQLTAIQLPRAQAMVGHPIIFSLLIVVAVGLIWLDLVRLPRAVRGCLLVLLAWGLAVSGTRSAMIALGAAAIYLALVAAKTVGRRIRNGLMIGTAAVVLAIIPATAGFLATALANLSDSGSYTHRTDAWRSLPEIMAHRGLVELLLGSGAGSEYALFGAGFLQQDGLTVVDNQLVTTLIVAGCVGLVILLGLLVRTLLFGSTPVRVTLIMLTVMLNTFDLLRWPGPALLVFLCLGLVDNTAFRRVAVSPVAEGSPPATTPQAAVVEPLASAGP